MNKIFFSGAISVALFAVLTGCMTDDDVAGEATSQVKMTRRAVPEGPARPTSRSNVKPLSGTPAPANAPDDPPPPVPLKRSDARIDDRIDAQFRESEGRVPAGPQGRADRVVARMQTNTKDISVPKGYRVSVLVDRLSYPVDITFGDGGETYIAEAGGHTYGTSPEKAPPARILRLMPDGSLGVLYDKVVPMEEIKRFDSSADMPEGLIPPLTGITWHNGKLYVSHRSRYSVLDPKTGEFKTIVNGLPSWGEFLNAKPIFDKDGKMVFFLSTQGNSGVIEEHWIKVIRTFNKPEASEVPGEDVELAGVNFDAPREPKKKPGPQETAKTGVYVPLGTATQPGQVIKGKKLCNGAFFRCDPDGSNLERIAWGFRSSFGYRYSDDGRLIMTQNSANPMKPRGIRFDLEAIYEVVAGEWYGWPDFYSSIPITDKRFKVRGGPQSFVLTQQTHQRLLKGKDAPRTPLATLPVHSAAEGMVFGRESFGIEPDTILVAEMGSIVPLYKDADWPPTEPGEYDVNVPEEKPAGVQVPWPGFKVSKVNLTTGQHSPFLANKSGKPASATGEGGLERPIQLEWGKDGGLYIVDFGTINFDPKGMQAQPQTGVIWKVMKTP